MTERRSQYDISNTIDISDTYQVQQAVLDVFADVYPTFNRQTLQRAFEDCNQLFDGEHPDYLPCDTLYHDKQHTMDMTLALSRLINGHDRSVAESERIGPDRAMLGIITALYHDSGYMRRKYDRKHHNGAEYTLTHVSRSAEYLKRYFHKIDMGELAQHSANMVHYTGLEVSPAQITLPDEKTHKVGHMLGTSDLIAQMSDRCYLEKCYQRLYIEFVLAGIAVQIDKQGKEHIIYDSAEDLLRKTPSFFEHEIKIRLDKLFNKVYEYETAYFKGEFSYIQGINKNLELLQKILATNNFEILNRKPPENYGTENFPGLEEYLNQYPQQKARFKAK
ncbi:MAG: hypothetical protein OEY06_06860 [Gammaproteobacteria bacterium]|nr:hypothetical protein [Gammaproteobacteria bacterium]